MVRVLIDVVLDEKTELVNTKQRFHPVDQLAEMGVDQVSSPLMAGRHGDDRGRYSLEIGEYI